MIPITERQQSAGEGLGQQTGGNVASDSKEARHLTEMMAPGHANGNFVDYLTIWEDEFLQKQIVASLFPAYEVTGKQLFKLRDIKDKLVERGVL